MDNTDMYKYNTGSATARKTTQEKIMTNKQEHFFASTYLRWAVGKTEKDALKRLKEKHQRMEWHLPARHVRMWRAPLNIAKAYNIKRQEPQVKGAIRVSLTK